MTEEEYFVKTAWAIDNLVAGIPEEHRAKVVPIASTIGKIIANRLLCEWFLPTIASDLLQPLVRITPVPFWVCLLC